MWVYVIVVLFFVIFIYIGLYTEVGGTHEDKIVKWFKKQGYENIEVQYGTPQKQFMYNMHEIFIPADYYDVECEKNGSIDKKIIRVKFGSISEFDSSKLF